MTSGPLERKPILQGLLPVLLPLPRPIARLGLPGLHPAVREDDVGVPAEGEGGIEEASQGGVLPFGEVA